MGTKAILCVFIKPLLKLTGWFSPQKASAARKRLKQKGWPVFALLICLMLSGCVVSDYFTLAGNKWVYGNAGEDSSDTETAVAAYDQTEAQELANKSPRIGNKTLPVGEPTIKITGYTWGSGSVTFESKTCGSGKVPEGYEYLFVITNGQKTDNAAASHGTRDRRLWEKVSSPTAFMITLVADGRGRIVEYSEVVRKP